MPIESPSSNAGRKSLGEATYITISLTDKAFTLLSEGAELLASAEGKKPSKASWFRVFIEQLLTRTPASLLTTSELDEKWSQLEPCNKITLKLTVEQQIFIRQVECAFQALDWSRHLARNEACSILTELEGPTFNRFLAFK